MPLWMHNGEKQVQVDWRKKNIGCDVLLVCPGESAHDLESYDIHRPGIMTVALGDAVRYCKPDMFIGVRKPTNYPAWLHHMPLTKVYSGGWCKYQIGGMPVHWYPNTFFFDYYKKHDTSEPIDIADDSSFYWDDSSISASLRLLMWMGARRIVLAGMERPCDSIRGDSTTYEHAIVAMMRLIGHTRKLCDITTCTPVCEAGSWLPYTGLPELIRRWPERNDYSLVKAIDIPKPDGDVGIVTGVDEHLEDILEWWLANVRKHNPTIPICVMDFGMSDAFVNSKLSELLKVYGADDMIIKEDVPHAYILKPHAILRSPYLNTLWMDVDVEVRGNVAILLDGFKRAHAAGEARVLAAVDPHDIESGTEIRYNAGVFCCRRDDPFVRQWAAECERCRARGDQEPFNQAIDTMRVATIFMPSRFNWEVPTDKHNDRQYATVPSDVVAVHHLCECGKERIRAMIRKEKIRATTTTE